MAGPGLATNRTLKSTPAQHRDDHNTAHAVLDLFDVDMAPVNGDVLTWDSSASLWAPAVNASSGGGGDIEDPFDPGYFIAGGSGVGNLSNAYLFVAASDASPRSKNAADYVCDGVSDQVKILTAVNALPANGGMVMLSEGNFVVDSSVLVQKDSVHLMGTGTGQKAGSTQSGVGTKITATGAITGSVVKVQRAANDRPVYGATLTHFTVDVASVGSNVDAVLFRSNRGYIEHVHTHRATGHGFHVQGYSSPVWDTYDTTLAHVQAGDCAGDGIFLDSNANDVHLTHPILYNNNYNIRLKGSSAQISTPHCYDATLDNIKFDGGGSRTKIIGGKIEGAGQHGLNIDSTNGGYADIQVIGTGFNTNGDSADNTYDHIILQGPSGNGIGRTHIASCSFGHKTSVTANKARYGVNLSGSCAQSTVIVGCSFGPSPQFLSGSTHQIATAPINNSGNSSFPAYIRGNANAFDDPALPVINAREAPYNVYGSGDLAPNMQAVLDAVPVGGAIIKLPNQDIRIDTQLVIQTDGTILEGHGAGNRYGATQAATGTRIHSSVITSGNLIKVQRAALDRTVYGVKFKDLAIDGRSSGSGVTGVLWEVNNGEMDNVAVHQVTGVGVIVQGYSSWPGADNKFKGCDFSYNATGFGFGANGINNKFLGTVFSSNTSDGIELTQPGQQFSSCDFHHNTRYGVFFNGGGHRSTFAGSRVRLNGQHGVVADSTNAAISDVAFTGCDIHTNGITTTNTYDNIIHLGPSGNAISRFKYVGNSIYYNSSESANKPRYGVNLSTTATQNSIVSQNTLGPASHWGTGPINDASSAGSPTQIRNNIGYVTEASGNATVVSGTTSIAVAHGLGAAPAMKDVSLTPINNLNASTKWWISAVDATNITVTVNADPTGSGAQFVWKVART